MSGGRSCCRTVVLDRAPLQLPVGSHKVAGVAAGVAQQIVLVLGLCLPEFTGRPHLGYHLARPQAGRLDIGDGVDGDLALDLAGVVDAGAIRRATVVALPVGRGGIVDLEEEFQEVAVAQFARIEHHFDRLGVTAMIAIGGVGNVTAAITHARARYAGQLADQILHAPEAPSRKDRSFGRIHGELQLLQCRKVGDDRIAFVGRGDALEEAPHQVAGDESTCIGQMLDEIPG